MVLREQVEGTTDIGSLGLLRDSLRRLGAPRAEKVLTSPASFVVCSN
jgi:hypothetical protein